MCTSPLPQDVPGDASPLVSVVMATNRKSPYLRTALESVVAQSFEDWEVVLVSDGCPDPEGLERAVSGIPALRLLLQPPRGVGAARNLGLASAAGSLVTFLDDDDLWPPDRLRLQAAALHGRPDSIGCYGEFVFVDAEGRPFADGWASSGERVARAGAFHVGTLMVRRGALELAGGFNPLLALQGDLDLNLRLARLGPLLHLPDRLLSYRRHGENITRSAAALDYSRAVYRHHYRLARLDGADETATAILERVMGQERYHAVRSARAAASAWRAGQRRSAAGEAWRAARCAVGFTDALARQLAGR